MKHYNCNVIMSFATVSNDFCWKGPDHVNILHHMEEAACFRLAEELGLLEQPLKSNGGSSHSLQGEPSARRVTAAAGKGKAMSLQWKQTSIPVPQWRY
eukprot:3133986-Amphidinium_carterae.1